MPARAARPDISETALRIFLSHQQRDSTTALHIQQRLANQYGISSYLDVTDRLASVAVDRLADYIRTQMANCTHLLAVLSPNTTMSQWVPWEIGVATEKEYPLASYSQNSLPPEFLRKWPYLRSDSDLDRYVRAIRAQQTTETTQARFKTASIARRSGVEQFYRTLKAELGQ